MKFRLCNESIESVQVREMIAVYEEPVRRTRPRGEYTVWAERTDVM